MQLIIKDAQTLTVIGTITGSILYVPEKGGVIEIEGKDYAIERIRTKYVNGPSVGVANEINNTVTVYGVCIGETMEQYN